MEYKCTNAGLNGVDLITHYHDMNEYTFICDSRENERTVKLSQETVIHRYNKMVEYGLLCGCKLDYSKIKIDSKIVFLVTHMDEIKVPLLRQRDVLLNEIHSFNAEGVLFVQSKDENILLTKDSFKPNLNI